MGQEIITGNYYNKYESSNPLYKYLTNRLVKTISDTIPEKADSIFEVGMGEGYLAHRLTENKSINSYYGVDIDPELVEMANGMVQNGIFQTGSAYDLNKYVSKKYNYIIISEVLEHLDHPSRALKEIKKLNFDRMIITVPNEPLWRFLNLMRFKYVKDFGNTPGHLQHWNLNSLCRLIETAGFTIINAKKVFPWLYLECSLQK